MLETFWKVVEAIIETRLKFCITFHDVLHGLLKGRGPVTDILELKLNQELISIDQDPIFLMFLDLRKEYVTLNLVRILMTMESYGAGPHMCGILAYFWEQHHIYYFQEKRGTT